MATFDRTLAARLAPRRRASFLTRLFETDGRWRQRHALRDMPDWLLQDIGLTRAEAEEEASRPAWDAPAFWRR